LWIAETRESERLRADNAALRAFRDRFNEVFDDSYRLAEAFVRHHTDTPAIFFPAGVLSTNEDLNLSFDCCYSRIIVIGQDLNLIAERLNLAFVRIEPRREDMNLIVENLDSQVDLSEVLVCGGGTAFFAPISLVERRN
jgi:hypothetical protein